MIRAAVLLAALGGPAMADDATCAAFWLGTAAAWEERPGVTEDAAPLRVLGEAFRDKAGAAAVAPLIDGMRLLALAYLDGDAESIGLWERTAAVCDEPDNESAKN